MASNNWRLSMLVIFLLLIGVFFAPRTATAEASNVHYQVANANHLALTSDAHLTVSFGHAHVGTRYKRQAQGDNTAAAVDGGAVSADATASPANGSQVLPDDANGPGSSVTSDDMATAQTTTTSSTTTTATPAPETSPPINPFDEADTFHDMHKYYNSSIMKDGLNDYWVELADTPKHDTLSHGHRVAVVIPLKFKFYFYGHSVENVTVATGGFIYMSPFLHKWLTATQYIAPLMANFDPSIAEGSSIYYKSFDTQFIVEWRDVKLKDQNSTGGFSFQAILKSDSSVTFVYKKVPLGVSKISDEQHPVKIGLSDAYYNDTFLPQFNIKKRTIYEYHKVEVPTNTILDGTVVILSSLPTCNRLDDCDSCTEHVDVNFDCHWCNKIGRCSDGYDWFRQHWDRNGCKETACPQRPSTQPGSTGSDIEVGTAIPTSRVSPSPARLASGCPDGECGKKDFPKAVVIVVTLALVALIAAVVGWVFYAYTHPTSASGMWLMEHRPSQIKAKIRFWKNNTDSSAKYKAETEA